MSVELLEKKLKVVEDFPKPGVRFLDISPLLADGEVFSMMIDQMCEPLKGKNIDQLVAVESRGFVLAAAMAQKLKTGLVMVRKRGKLPGQTLSVTYDLEYGTDQLEILPDAIKAGSRVQIVDDVLATGGTAKATYDLCQKVNANVLGFSFLIEIAFLKGQEKLQAQSQILIKK